MAQGQDKPGSLAAAAVLVAALLAGCWANAVYPSLFYVPRERAPDHMDRAGTGLVCRAWYREPVLSSVESTIGQFDIVLTRPLAWLPVLERIAYRVTLPEARFLTSAGEACDLAREVAERKWTGEWANARPKPSVKR